MFVSESPYSHLVKTLVVGNVEYKYIDITAIEPSYGAFLELAMVVTNAALRVLLFKSVTVIIFYLLLYG